MKATPLLVLLAGALVALLLTAAPVQAQEPGADPAPTATTV